LSETSKQNQRKGHRLPVRLPYSLVTSTVRKETTIPAESINVSKTGMRVKAETELSSGQAVEVILMVGTPRPVMARVVWTEKTPGSNQFEFGIEYITPPTRPA
jgi:hypothetical protein